MSVSAGRLLVVTADDLGMTPGVTRGILAAHEHGIVTSASLMVLRAAAAHAASLVREHPRLAVGLHVDLGEWWYGDERWQARYEVTDLSDVTGVERAVTEQLDAFRTLVGGDPTHLDSHQHVHLHEPAASVLRGVAARLGVPLRHHDPRIAYVGDFHGQTATGETIPGAVDAVRLAELVARVAPGWTELACHPGDGGDAPGPYRHERALELRALCDPLVRDALRDAGVELRSFRDLAVG